MKSEYKWLAGPCLMVAATLVLDQMIQVAAGSHVGGLDGQQGRAQVLGNLMLRSTALGLAVLAAVSGAVLLGSLVMRRVGRGMVAGSGVLAVGLVVLAIDSFQLAADVGPEGRSQLGANLFRVFLVGGGLAVAGLVGGLRLAGTRSDQLANS